MYQTFDMAYLVYKTKEKLHKKMDGLIYFIKESTRIINEVPEQLWKPYYIFEKDIEYNNLNKEKRDIYKSIHVNNFKMQPLWKRFKFSFISGYKFQMTCWYMVDTYNKSIGKRISYC